MVSLRRIQIQLNKKKQYLIEIVQKWGEKSTRFWWKIFVVVSFKRISSDPLFLIMKYLFIFRIAVLYAKSWNNKLNDCALRNSWEKHGNYYYCHVSFLFVFIIIILIFIFCFFSRKECSTIRTPFHFIRLTECEKIREPKNRLYTIVVELQVAWVLVLYHFQCRRHSWFVICFHLIMKRNGKNCDSFLFGNVIIYFLNNK